MTRYEYKVLPAPVRGMKAKGVKTTEARFAHALMEIMNELGREGWEYQRTDTLPCEERVGLTGRTTRFQNMLVFRRAEPEARPEPRHEDSPEATQRATVRRYVPTFSSRTRVEDGPPLRAVGELGRAPQIGPAPGNGTSKPGGDGGVAAE